MFDFGGYFWDLLILNFCIGILGLFVCYLFMFLSGCFGLVVCKFVGFGF